MKKIENKPAQIIIKGKGKLEVTDDGIIVTEIDKNGEIKEDTLTLEDLKVLESLEVTFNFTGTKSE